MEKGKWIPKITYWKIFTGKRAGPSGTLLSIVQKIRGKYTTIMEKCKWIPKILLDAIFWLWAKGPFRIFSNISEYSEIFENI